MKKYKPTDPITQAALRLVVVEDLLRQNCDAGNLVGSMAAGMEWNAQQKTLWKLLDEKFAKLPK